MPAPSAQYILGMLNPYQGFRPDSSGAIALGQQGIQMRGQNEQKRQFDLENARADEYLGFQQHQWEVGNAQKERDKRVEAYADFNDAVIAGDIERAEAAANILRAFGVEVEPYEGDGGAPAAEGEAPEASPYSGDAPGAAEGAVPPEPAARSAAGTIAAESPTTMVARSAAARRQGGTEGKPPNWLQREMERRGEAAPPADPFAGLEAPEMERPSPARTLSPQPEDMLRPTDREDSFTDAGGTWRRLSPEEAQRLGVKASAGWDIYTNGNGEYAEARVDPRHPALLQTRGAAGPAKDSAPVERELPREDTAGGIQDIARDARPKPGKFPGEIGGKRYDPQTGNLIREPGDLPAPGEQPPRRGYRIKFEGREINISPEQVQQRQRERISAAFDPIISSAPEGNDKAAARAAKDTAMGLVGLVPIGQAIKRGFETYDNERDRSAALQRAKYSAAGRQVNVGFDKDTTQRQAGVFDDVMSIVKEYTQNDEVRQARATVSNSDRVLDMTKSGNSTAEWAAQQSVLKEFVRGVASDRDLRGFLGSFGHAESILKEFNAWFDGGKMPEGINQKVAQLAIAAKSHYEKKLLRSAAEAYEFTRNHDALAARVTPEELERHARNVFRRIYGREMPQPKGKGGGAAKPGAKGQAEGGASPDKQKRADELLKKMRRK